MNYLKNGHTLRLVALATALTCLPCLANGQTIARKLAQRVASFDSTNASPVGQLIELSQAFRIPMGVEWLDEPGDKPAPPVRARNTTVRGVLTQILSRHPGYTFDSGDGIVHVSKPALARDERDFLNIRISQFQVQNVNLFQASYELANAIRDVLHPSAGYGGGTGHGPDPRTGFDVRNITFSVRNSTVRGILNRIAKEQGNAMWVVRLKQQQTMSNGRFYAQAAAATTDAIAPDFHWNFIALGNLQDAGQE
jgi:hypothetical protein